MSDNIFLARLHYELHGQNCENGYWFHGTSTCINEPWASINAEIDALIFQFDSTVLPLMLQYYVDDVHMQRLDVATKKPAEGPVVTHIYESLTGLQGNDGLPGFNAGVLSLNTGLGGRKNRGRSYYSGIPEDFAADGLLSLAQRTNLQLIGDEFMLRFGPGATNPCWRYMLFHQTAFNNGVSLENCLSFITSTTARSEIRSQRKRMLGHGA